MASSLSRVGPVSVMMLLDDALTSMQHFKVATGPGANNIWGFIVIMYYELVIFYVNPNLETNNKQF